MYYDQNVQAWVLPDPAGKPLFYFYADGSIGFPKVGGPYARIRIHSGGAGIDVADNTGTWRTIPFTYGSPAATNGTVPKQNLK